MPSITNLEEQILILYRQNKKNREIARELKIHHNTVRYWLNKNNLKAHYFGLPIDMVSEDTARCRKCLEIKSLNEFQYGRKGREYEYRFSYCNLCRSKQIRSNLNSDIIKFLNNHYNYTKRRAKKNNILFDITKFQYIEQYHSQNGLCFYTDEKMICQFGNGKHRNSLSIDRIVPPKGYVSGNFVFCSNKINTCKNDLILDEIKKWMPDWYQRIMDYLEDK